LINSLLIILPDEKIWYADKKFLHFAHLLFFIMTNAEARPNDTRRVLAIGNRKEVAALCDQATTLDLFLYLWNLYILWFEREREENKAFATYLHSRINNTLSHALVQRSKTHRNPEKMDHLLALAGLLYFVGLAVDTVEKTCWLSQLPSFDELVKRVQPKTFIPGVFFLLGLEWIFDKKDGVPQQIWERLLPKAAAYTEKIAALEHLRDFVRARAGSKA
jgi:hypothetical protein